MDNVARKNIQSKLPGSLTRCISSDGALPISKTCSIRSDKCILYKWLCKQVWHYRSSVCLWNSEWSSKEKKISRRMPQIDFSSTHSPNKCCHAETKKALGWARQPSNTAHLVLQFSFLCIQHFGRSRWKEVRLRHIDKLHTSTCTNAHACVCVWPYK